LPNATILLGCWAENLDREALEELREAAKADIAAATLREAMMMCRTAAGVQDSNEGLKSTTPTLKIA
jgi:hypothetical protein